MRVLSWTWWNLFLALVPVLVAVVLAWGVEAWRSRPSRLGAIGLGLLGLVWLAFLPNTCYLMTEWRHFLFDRSFTIAREMAASGSGSKLKVLKHFVFFAAYSGFGVVCFGLAIRPVARVLGRGCAWPALLAPPFFLAVSLGVYLGLVVRLNSWDLATRPSLVLEVTADAVANGTLLALIVGFGGFLWMVYQAVDIWLDGLAVRWRGSAEVGRSGGRHDEAMGKGPVCRLAGGDVGG